MFQKIFKGFGSGVEKYSADEEFSVSFRSLTANLVGGVLKYDFEGVEITEESAKERGLDIVLKQNPITRQKSYHVSYNDPDGYVGTKDISLSGDGNSISIGGGSSSVSGMQIKGSGNSISIGGGEAKSSSKVDKQ